MNSVGMLFPFEKLKDVGILCADLGELINSL